MKTIDTTRRATPGRRGLRLLLTCALTLGAALLLTSQGLATTYYVATTGNDTFNGLSPDSLGGTSGPFRTINRARSAVKPGDTVMIRGGVYVGHSTWITDGTEASPITITNYNGETVVVDGNNCTLPGGTGNSLLNIFADWNFVSNIEVRYGSDAGVILTGAHSKATNLYVHHNFGGGIVAQGNYDIVENCRIYYNSTRNEYGRSPSGWGFGVSLCRYPSYGIIRGCTVWNNWGEGVSTFEGYHNTIEDNVIYDNFTVNLYVSDSQYAMVRRNLSYYTPGNRIQPYASSQNCLLLGDEGHVPASSDNIVVNNLCLGGDRCLVASGGNMTRTLVAYNTFVNAFPRLGTEASSVVFQAGVGTGGRFVNNIVVQDNVATYVGLCSASGVTFDHNCWSRSPLDRLRGTGDVVGNPLLSRAGSTLAGELGSEWFRITSGSPAKDKAVVLSQVAEDFARTPRGSAPDIGAFSLEDGSSGLTAYASGTPTSGLSPLTVNFSGSASGGSAPYSYEWNFGDGTTSSAQNPAHIYTAAGHYTATLTAIDGFRATAAAAVGVSVDTTITSVLVAYGSASTLQGQAPLTVNFTAAGNGGSGSYTYRWDFGDGGTSTSQYPSHIYTSSGTFAVKLVVTDSTGTAATYDLVVRTTSLVRPALNVSYVASPQAGQAPLPVRFAATATGGTGPYTYRWNFGDGTASTVQNPDHTFQTVGRYTVALTVTDSRSTTAMRTSVIQVQATGQKPWDRFRRRVAEPRIILR